MVRYLFASSPMFTTSGRCISKTPLYMEGTETVSPLANLAYKKGVEAFLAGKPRNSNPYLNSAIKELDVLWTAEDIWNLGWDSEKEKYGKSTKE